MFDDRLVDAGSEHIVTRLESRLGLRLLARTTRSVAPTVAGERIMQTLTPALRDLDSSIAALTDSKGRPSGTIRITSVEHAAKTVLTPAPTKFLPDHPEITVEIIID